MTDFSGFRGIVGKSAGPGGNLPAPYDLYLVQDTGLSRLYTGGPDQFTQVTGLTAPPPGEWHHIAVTWMDNEVTHYLDGQVDGQGLSPAPLIDSDTTLRHR